MSNIAYYLNRFMVAHETVARRQAGWKEAEHTKTQLLDGLEREIEIMIHTRVRSELEDLRLFPVDGERE